MSENRKYYFLKLKDNFFDSNEIKVLEAMPNGVYYSNLLQKLYLQSLKWNGALMFNELLPYDEKLISTVTNLSEEIVRKGLEVLASLRLVEKKEDGIIYMLNIQNYIGKSSSEGERKRLYREKLEEEKRMLGQSPDKCPPEIEIDKESDIDLESDKKIESDKKLESDEEIESRKKAEIETELAIESLELLHYFEKVTGIHKGLNMESLETAVAMHGAEYVKMAINNAVKRGKPTIKYIFGILKNWSKEGYPKKGDLDGDGCIDKDFRKCAEGYEASSKRGTESIEDEPI